MAALIVGFMITLFMQPYIIDWLLPAADRFYLGFTWQLCIGTALSTLVCCLGKPQLAQRGQSAVGAQ